MDMLNKHPQITARAEELVNLKDAGAQAQESWLLRLYNPKRPWIKAVGHKTKLWDVVDIDRFRSILCDLNVRIIVLSRQNALKAVVSSIRSIELFERTGRWELVSENDRVEKTRVDPEDVIRRLKSWDFSVNQLDAFVASVSLPQLLIDYESLVGETESTLRKFGDFLEVKVVPERLMKSRIKKLTTDDLSQAVANYKELAEALRGTEYAHYLD